MITVEQAIEIAKSYGLQEELKRWIDVYDCTPYQALFELNLI